MSIDSPFQVRVTKFEISVSRISKKKHLVTLELIKYLMVIWSFKGATTRYFESFLPRPNLKYGLSAAKPKSNGLLRKKNTKGVILEQKGTRMTEDCKDWNGLEMTILKSLANYFKIHKPWRSSFKNRFLFSIAFLLLCFMPMSECGSLFPKKLGV